MDPDAVDDLGHVHHGGATDADVLDFSANVNPATPAGVEDCYRAALGDARRYPDDDYPEFRRAAAAVVDCDPEAVVPTAGGLGAIRLAVATTVEPGDRAIVPAPSFGEYAREVRLQGGDPSFVSPDELLAVDDAALEAAAIAIACTPNNPTGDAYDPDALRSFAERCRAAGTTLLVDEAFLGFTERESVAGTPGTVVARSLTKLYGLPGLRAGYAVAGGALRDRIRTAREPWALGAPAAAVGAHCLRDRDFVEQTRDRVREERERLADALAGRFEVRDAEAPFLLLAVGADPNRGDGRDGGGVGDGGDVGDGNGGDVDGTVRDPSDVDALLERARERGVAIRDARTFRGLDRHVRVAVRRPSENDRLLAALLPDRATSDSA